MQFDRRQLIAGTAALAATGGFGHPSFAQSAVDLILPGQRIVSYYGFPRNELMGILGQYSKKDLLPLLQQQGAIYEELDPSRPVQLALETMNSVAMRDPGPDNDHLEYTDPDTIDDYIKFCEQNDLLLFLDVQFGRNSIERELYKVSPYLEYPHVHLALDPEFHVGPDEVPGEVLGAIDAVDVTTAQQHLATMVTDRGLPPKILLIHQFNWASITNPDQIGPVDGVQLVHEIDGWGPPEEKVDTYNVLTGLVSDLHGFKLWYEQDVPLMTETEVLALDPPPDVVIYQ